MQYDFDLLGYSNTIKISIKLIQYIQTEVV